MILLKGISIKVRKIGVIKDWLKPKSVHNIQVFLGFANFYLRFIQGFSKIAALLILMLKTTRSLDKPAFNRNDSNKSTSSRNDNSKPVSRKNNGNNEVDGFSVGGNSVKYAKKSEKLFKSRKSKSEKMSKSRNLAKSEKKLSKSGNSTNFDATEDKPKFLTPNTRTAFNRLRLAFTEASILWHFNPKYHIWIETDVLSYAIGGVLNKLTSGINLDGVVIKTNLGQWHLVAFFSRKIIPVETCYKTHNSKFLAIIEAFKTWRHYLESCKYKMLVFTNYNNLCCFINTKNLSSKQVHWAQKLFQYYFQINYR